MPLKPLDSTPEAFLPHGKEAPCMPAPSDSTPESHTPVQGLGEDSLLSLVSEGSTGHSHQTCRKHANTLGDSITDGELGIHPGGSRR